VLTGAHSRCLGQSPTKVVIALHRSRCGRRSSLRPSAFSCGQTVAVGLGADRAGTSSERDATVDGCNHVRHTGSGRCSGAHAPTRRTSARSRLVAVRASAGQRGFRMQSATVHCSLLSGRKGRFAVVQTSPNLDQDEIVCPPRRTRLREHRGDVRDLRLRQSVAAGPPCRALPRSTASTAAVRRSGEVDPCRTQRGAGTLECLM
jgi:hypothetical protein